MRATTLGGALEPVETHSKAKLALAVFTSPAAAFEEINRRQLFGTGLAIVALTGLVSMVGPIMNVLTGQPMQWLVLGQCNPVTWVGVCMLYAFALQKLLKWIGSDVDYIRLLTMMGWAQLSMLLAEIATVSLGIGTAQQNANVAQAGFAGMALFGLWYVMLMGTALNTLTGAPKARGILSYLVVHIAATIAFTFTYSNTRASLFQNAPLGIGGISEMLNKADKLPWTAAAVVGLVIGVFLIGKHFEWPLQRIRLNAAAAGLAGLAVFGVYTYALSKHDYYGRLAQAQVAYSNGRYEDAAKSLKTFLPESKDDVMLMLDIADAYYLSKNDSLALEYYQKPEAIIKQRKAVEGNKLLARIYDGEGMLLDAQGRYPEALALFGQASKEWPEFREPWVRMAVTYDRMGMYNKAIDSANHAIKKLDSDAIVAWIALAEAFARTGDTKQAKAAIAMVAGKDKDLATRIGPTTDDWKSVVGKLTREDMKFPLESQLAPEPKKPEKPKKK